jgi:iron only hydrogenase large subunit-like protein
MFKLGGINFDGLPETPFDTFAGAPMETVASPAEFKDVQPGIQAAEIAVKGKRVKMLIAHGFAPARVVLDSISKGECVAGIIRIMSCPKDSRCP